MTQKCVHIRKYRRQSRRSNIHMCVYVFMYIECPHTQNMYYYLIIVCSWGVCSIFDVNDDATLNCSANVSAHNSLRLNGGRINSAAAIRQTMIQKQLTPHTIRDYFLFSICCVFSIQQQPLHLMNLFILSMTFDLLNDKRKIYQLLQFTIFFLCFYRDSNFFYTCGFFFHLDRIILFQNENRN